MSASGETGDIGRAIEVGALDHPGAGAIHPHRRLDPCHSQTIFGEITVERMGYCCPGAPAVHIRRTTSCSCPTGPSQTGSSDGRSRRLCQVP
jgi:hypothetical protein